MIDILNNSMLSLFRRYGYRNFCHQVSLYTEYNNVIFFRVGDVLPHALYPEKETKAHCGLFGLAIYSGMVFQQSLFWIQRSLSKSERDKNQLRDTLLQK